MFTLHMHTTPNMCFQALEHILLSLTGPFDTRGEPSCGLLVGFACRLLPQTCLPPAKQRCSEEKVLLLQPLMIEEAE